jgi:hypothetical protein
MLSIYCCFHLYCIYYITDRHIFIGGIKSNQTQNHVNAVKVPDPENDRFKDVNGNPFSAGHAIIGKEEQDTGYKADYT